MKKTRIISMLLSAMLAISSFPMMVSAADAEAIPLDTELLTATEDVSKWTSAGAEVTATGATNKYLYIYDRTANSAGPVLTFGTLQSLVGSSIDAAKDYEVVLHVKARTQSDVAGDFSWRDTFATTNHSFTNSVNDDWKNLTSPGKIVKGNATVKVNLRGQYSYNTLAPVMMDDIALYYREQGSTGNYSCAKFIDFENCTYNTDIATLGFAKSASEKYLVVEETPHIAISGTAAGNKDQMTANHSSVYGQQLTLDAGVYQLSGDIRMMYFYQSSFHNAGSYGADKGIKLAADTAIVQGQNGWVTGDGGTRDNLPLASNYYHVLYQVKFGASASVDGVNNIQDVNYRDVNLSLVSGEDRIVLDTVRFDETWTGFNVVFEVAAGQTVTIDGIGIEGTGKGYDIDPFNVDNLSFKKLANLAASVDENEQIIDISEADLDSNSAIAYKFADGFVDGNKYLQFAGRINNNDSLVIRTVSAFPTETDADQYEIKFEVRASSAIKKGDGSANNKITLRTYAASENGDGVNNYTAYSYVTINNVNEWQTYTIDYDAAAFPYGIIVRGGPGLGFNDHNSSAPFEIDNVRVVKKGTETVVDGLCDTFDEATGNSTDFETANFTYHVAYGYPSAPNGKNARISVETDSVLYTAEISGTKDAFTYNLPADTVLEPGIYTFSGMFKNGEYVNFGVADSLAINSGEVIGGNKVHYSVIDNYANYGYIVAEPDTPTDARVYPQRIAYDNNAFDITATITTESNGTEKVYTADTVHADAGWTGFAYTIVVKETTTLKSITFDAVHALDGSPVNVAKTYLDFKDLQIVYALADDEKGGIPNVGIVMMLMAKKGGNISKLPTADMAAVEAGTTAGEAVTTYTAKAFKADVTDNAGNKYMTVSNRVNNGDGITIKGTNLDLDAAKSYELKFDIRAAVTLDKIAGHKEGETFSRIWIGGTNVKADVHYNDSTWTAHTVTLDSAKFKDIGYSIVGGIGATYAHPYDIDNVRVVEAGTGKVVAAIDFEDMDLAAIAAEGVLSKNGVDFTYRYAYKDAVNGKAATIEVVADTAYARAVLTGTANKMGTITYKEATTLEPGTYTLTAMVRNGNFNGSNNDTSVNTAPNYIMREPDNKTTKTPQLITENNNYVNVVAMVVAEDVVFTSKAAPAKVWAAWTPVEYTFTVDKATNVASIRFGATHALLDTELAVGEVTLDVKDVVISKAK